MIPWNGQQDNLIDRFDGRALLDFYREPDPQARCPQKTEDELELEEVRRGAAILSHDALRFFWTFHAFDLTSDPLLAFGHALKPRYF